jgi:hypothetical protein
MRAPAPFVAALVAALALAAPGRAQPPEPGSGAPAAEAAPSALDQTPYEYPIDVAAVEPQPYPDRPWRYPAAAVDLLLVRPAMVVGLAGGALLLVATLPVTAPTLTTDDAAQALLTQAQETFARPLGDF